MALFDATADLMQRALQETSLLQTRGRVIEVAGTVIKAALPSASIGELCYLESAQSDTSLLAEVIGITGSTATLAPLGDMTGLSGNTWVRQTGSEHVVHVGEQLLGRVLSGLGDPIDGGGALNSTIRYPVSAAPPHPLKRKLISTPMALGLRAIDGLLTCGEGQRLGIFSGPGVGKTTLLSMLVKHAQVDVVVVALIGERGREVREFIDQRLGADGMRKAVLVVATANTPALERVKAGYVATAIAEFFRERGKRVLLLMDSVTRFARAQREIGLAAGEAPTRRGFPPSVFSALSTLMERGGQSESGSITALYTVLVEGDDLTEPVADEARSILDGHIVLSNALANAGQYPAIDVLSSISRIMDSVIDAPHRAAAVAVRTLLTKYADAELLIKVGEYQKGTDPLTDQAIEKMDAIRAFLRQGENEQVDMPTTIASLKALVSA